MAPYLVQSRSLTQYHGKERIQESQLTITCSAHQQDTLLPHDLVAGTEWTTDVFSPWKPVSSNVH